MQIKQSASVFNRSLSSNLWRLRSANHVKFTEEYLMSMEKHRANTSEMVDSVNALFLADWKFLSAQHTKLCIMSFPFLLDFIRTIESLTLQQEQRKLSVIPSDIHLFTPHPTPKIPVWIKVFN